VQKILGVGQLGPLPATFSGASAEVVTVLGTDYGGTLAIHPPKKATSSAYPSTITPDNQVYLQAFKAAAHRAHIPGMYPTVTQSSSEFVPYTTAMPIRTYVIRSSGKGYNSLYAMFRLNTIAGAYWGIEETRFTSAPILESPDQQRKADGRTYKFYFDGSHIHLIAFIEHGAAYWVQNTLRDDMSNADMIAIARSLKPVG